MSELLALGNQSIDMKKWEREVSPAMIMVGARAVEATLMLPVDETTPYEYVTTESGYEQAKQAGWHHYANVLFSPQQNSYLMTRYGKAEYDDLRARGFALEDGTEVVGLPDNYAVMQYDGDTPETAVIRERLLNPELPPLELELMPREHKTALSLLEKIPGIHEYEELYKIAERLIAFALYTQYTLYGDPDIGQANQIVGTLEKAEDDVFAYYHNGFGLVEDSEELLAHFEDIDAPTLMRVLALIAEIYSDIVYGNGRKRDNETGYDELRSAELLYGHAVQLGCPRPYAEWMKDAAILTGFDEETGWQPGRISSDPGKRAVTASDLQVLSQRGTESTDRIVAEDIGSNRWSKESPLRQVKKRKGVRRFDSMEEFNAFVYENRDEPVSSPHGKTLGEVHAKRKLGSAGFHEDYEPPEGWTRDDKNVRYLNSADIREEVAAFAA